MKRKIIITMPAPILSSKELLRIKDPINVAVAPKQINTIEKPNVNKIIEIN